MPRSLIALGTNLGDRQAMLRRAVDLLSAEDSIWPGALSSLHETAPAGGPDGQGPFLNAAATLDTSLSPVQLHQVLRRIEIDLGRHDAPRWGPRAIDLDLLLYDDQIVSSQGLAVPHPRMAFRRFVLAPAAEVAPQMVHPLLGWTIARLLEHINTATPYVALLGPSGSGKSALAERVARAVGGSFLADPLSDPAQMASLDSSGHAEGRQIQFLDRASSLLRSRDWHVARSFTVSDFYFDQCLAYARIVLDDPPYERFRQAWSAANEMLVAPKLLVVLDTWEEGLAARAAAPLAPDAPPADRLRRELLALTARGNQGPVLYAGRNDPQAQFDEITAAIAAMG